MPHCVPRWGVFAQPMSHHRRFPSKDWSVGIFGRIESKRLYKIGYMRCVELSDRAPYGGSGFMRIDAYYTLDGYFIGNSTWASRVCRRWKLKHLQPSGRDGNTVSIGFDEEKQKWVGWSHRARCSFGIGDRLFEGDYGDEHTLFVKHGRILIKTLAQAKMAAMKFAQSVS